MVTAREAFKLGFLQRCADEQLTKEQVQLRIKKASIGQALLEHIMGTPGTPKVEGTRPIVSLPDLPEGMERFTTPATKATPGFMSKHPYLTGGALLGAALGIPALLGMGAGHLTRKLEGDFLDPEDVQKQELINEMKTLAHRSQHSQSKALGL
jgi:hypothetical protein